MERKKEKDNFGCIIEYKIPEVKRCPICRREVQNEEIDYIDSLFQQHPEVEDGGYQD
jgi:hypothetical protein